MYFTKQYTNGSMLFSVRNTYLRNNNFQNFG